MKKRLVAVISLSMLSVLLFVMPVLAYLFSAPITVTETTGVAYSMLATQDTLPTPWLISHGYMLSSGLDTGVSPTKPHMVAYDRLLLATPVAAYGQVNANFTTGNTLATSMDIITGYNGYITANDVAAWELGTDGSVEYGGYIDTSVASVGKFLLHKMGAFGVSVSAVGTLQASVFGLAAPANETLRPDGAGSETNISTVVGAATHWQATNDNNDATYVSDAGTIVYRRDLHSCANHVTSGGVINNVTVFTRIQALVGSPVTGMSALRTHSVVYDGAVNTEGGGPTTYQDVYATNPNTGLAWTLDEIDSMQIGVSINAQNVGRTVGCMDVWAIVNYSAETVTASAPVGAVTPGTHVVTATMTAVAGGTLTLTVATLAPVTIVVGAGVPNNGEDWVIMSDATPYATYYKHTVGGVLVGHYQPNAIVLGEVYSTGTVTVTNGDMTITGAGGAAWTADMVGSVFVSADGLYYTVASFTNATSMELTAVYGGGTLGGQTYTLNPRLPDRAGALEDGAITWGANPAGVAMTIGSLVGYTGAFSDTTDEVPPDRLPEVAVSDWYGDGTITKAATLTNPFRGLVTMVSDNTSLTEIQTWRWYGIGILVVAVALFAKLARGHQGITSIAAGAVIALLIAFDTNIFPLYLAVLAAGLMIGGVISERSHQI